MNVVGVGCWRDLLSTIIVSESIELYGGPDCRYDTITPGNHRQHHNAVVLDCRYSYDLKGCRQLQIVRRPRVASRTHNMHTYIMIIHTFMHQHEGKTEDKRFAACVRDQKSKKCAKSDVDFRIAMGQNFGQLKPIYRPSIYSKTNEPCTMELCFARFP